MAILAFIAIFVFDIPFPYIVLIAGIIGYAGSHFAADKFKAGVIMAVQKTHTARPLLMMTPRPRLTHALNGAD